MPAFLFWPLPEPGQTFWDWPDEWHLSNCAMCDRPARNGQLVVDHDHDTGLIRGRLCIRCNTDEARTNAPLWMLWRAGLNPARLFGHEESYSEWSGRVG